VKTRLARLDLATLDLLAVKARRRVPTELKKNLNRRLDEPSFELTKPSTGQELHEPNRTHTHTQHHTTQHNGRTIQGHTLKGLQLNTPSKHQRDLQSEDYNSPAPRATSSEGATRHCQRAGWRFMSEEGPLNCKHQDTFRFPHRRGPLPSRLGSKASNHRTWEELTRELGKC
jgi:hypothetical protein